MCNVLEKNICISYIYSYIQIIVELIFKNEIIKIISENFVTQIFYVHEMPDNTMSQMTHDA